MGGPLPLRMTFTQPLCDAFAQAEWSEPKKQKTALSRGRGVFSPRSPNRAAGRGPGGKTRSPSLSPGRRGRVTAKTSPKSSKP